MEIELSLKIHQEDILNTFTEKFQFDTLEKTIKFSNNLSVSRAFSDNLRRDRQIYPKLFIGLRYFYFAKFLPKTRFLTSCKLPWLNSGGTLNTNSVIKGAGSKPLIVTTPVIPKSQFMKKVQFRPI